MNGGSQPSFILQRNRLLSRRLITVPLIEFPPAGVTDEFSRARVADKFLIDFEKLISDAEQTNR